MKFNQTTELFSYRHYMVDNNMHFTKHCLNIQSLLGFISNKRIFYNENYLFNVKITYSIYNKKYFEVITFFLSTLFLV